jgi:hypothetical protein
LARNKKFFFGQLMHLVYLNLRLCFCGC